MTDILSDDPRFGLLRAALDPQGPIRDERPDPEIDRLEAAVSLIIRARESLEILLIKRATHEPDPWSGHMALPGGRWEPNDSGLLRTATRETFEETGIDLETQGRPLGRLDDVAPASPRLPPMRIAPFVFGVPRGVEATVASPELESVHWVTIERLRHPETSASVRIDFTGFTRTFPSYSVGEEHVWGLTHRILSGFLERYPEADLRRLHRD